MFRTTDALDSAQAAVRTSETRTALTVGDLAFMVAEDGPQAHEQSLLAVATMAQFDRPVLARLLIDESQPSIARARAYGLIAAHLGLATRIPNIEFEIPSADTPAVEALTPA